MYYVDLITMVNMEEEFWKQDIIDTFERIRIHEISLLALYNEI